jgi:hypothetical protein
MFTILSRFGFAKRADEGHWVTAGENIQGAGGTIARS